MPEKKVSRRSPPAEEFLMSPAEHRAHAFKLEKHGSELAKFLAAHHRHLAHHIQQLVNAGRARVRPRA